MTVRIDVHNHAFPEPALELLRSDPVYGVTLTGRQWHGGVHVDFEITHASVDPGAMLDELHSKQLGGAVVSCAPPLFYYHVGLDAGEMMARAVNRGLAEMCATAPDYLAWMATAPLQDPSVAVAVLDDAAAAGCVGIHVATAVVDRRIDDESFEPFWSAAERLALPVMIHPMYNEPNRSLASFYLDNVIGNQLETTVAIERLICAGVLERHSGLRLVLVHAGGYFPWQAGRLRHARTVRPELADSPVDPWAYLDRLWFDTITHDRAALRYLIERVGPSQVVVGTDLPFDMAMPDPVPALVDAVGEQDAYTISEANPAALFGLNGI